MPRNSPKPRSDSDVEARLPAGIKFVLAFVILLFIAGAAGLIYLNISNQAATAQANATATARAVASFLVQSISISVSPASIAAMTCGTPVNVTYTATITIAPGSPGGTVALTWSIGSSSTPASVTFAPGETVKTVSTTDMGILARNNSYPRNGSIASTSPNVINSTTVRPAGTCV